MRAKEFITEGTSFPVIAVDVQPEYAHYGDNASICEKIVTFVGVKQTGPVLMFVNAEDTGISGDTIDSIKKYWDDVITGGDDNAHYDEENDEYLPVNSPINWNRFTIVDKGFGHFRSWMDQGIPDSEIIKTIRLMYQTKVTDSRELFGGQDSDTYEQGIRNLLGPDYLIGLDDPITIGWVRLAQLKKFSGAYLVGGGRNECLREVELLMNAFNLKYKRIDSLVYG